MRNRILVICSFLFMLPFTSYSNQGDKKFSLTIHVDNLRNSKGIVQFALYNKNGSIPDENYKKCYKLMKAKITNGASVITFSDIPLGRYAVNIFHDENSNGKIDKGFILPKEGLGFSNFKTIGFSNRPSFSKTSFDLNADKTLKLTIVYM